MLYMNAASYYIPENRLHIKERASSLRMNLSEIFVYQRMYRISTIPSAENIKWIDFISQPIEGILSQSDIDPKKINYLIHCHTAKVIAPFGQSIIREVRERFGFVNAITFGTSINNCASSLVMLSLLEKIMRVSDPVTAILISADCAFTPVLQWIPNASLLGDGSAAVLVSNRGDKNQLLSTHFIVDGQYAKGIWLDKDNLISFEGKYVGYVTQVICEAVSKANISLANVRIIFPHNVNYLSWKRVAEALEYPIEKIYLKTLSEYSHCFGSDIFVNYSSAIENGELQAGDYFVMATVGLGAIFSAAVFQH